MKLHAAANCHWLLRSMSEVHFDRPSCLQIWKKNNMVHGIRLWMSSSGCLKESWVGKTPSHIRYMKPLHARVRNIWTWWTQLISRNLGPPYDWHTQCMQETVKSGQTFVRYQGEPKELEDCQVQKLYWQRVLRGCSSPHHQAIKLCFSFNQGLPRPIANHMYSLMLNLLARHAGRTGNMAFLTFTGMHQGHPGLSHPYHGRRSFRIRVSRIHQRYTADVYPALQSNILI